LRVEEEGREEGRGVTAYVIAIYKVK